MTFPETNAVMRTDESFRNQSEKEHHIGTSSLCRLELNMIFQFSLDYMHLVCMGVMQKVVYIWIKGPLKTRLGPADVLRLGDNLVKIRTLVPTEFVRKPRSISEFQHWKATEFRKFLLYTGVVCLRDVLQVPFYDNFSLFSVAIIILLSLRLSLSRASYARSLIILFVTHILSLYSKEMITYNLHGLVHLRDDINRFVPS